MLVGITAPALLIISFRLMGSSAKVMNSSISCYAGYVKEACIVQLSVMVLSKLTAMVLSPAQSIPIYTLIMLSVTGQLYYLRAIK
jgi:hypothetical protein